MGSFWYSKTHPIDLLPSETVSLTLQTPGYGIINATGDLWKAQRKAGLKFFGGGTLDSMIEDVLPEVYHSDSGMRRLLSKAAEENTVVDLQRLFLDLTTTIVGYMAYDVRITSLTQHSACLPDISRAN